MEQKDIVNYLNCVVEIEKNIYSLECSIEELKNKMHYLGKEGSYEEPNKPIKPTLEKKESKFFVFLGIGMLILALYLGSRESFFTLVLSFFVFILGLGFLGYDIFVTLPKNKLIKEQNDKALSEYNKRLAVYNNALSVFLNNKEKDEERIKGELLEIEAINTLISKLTIQLCDSKKRLKELYEYGIIHPKYRNLVAVCSFLDYFSAGLCYTFESPRDSIGGAYYLFENEMLHKQIVYELQKVNENLNHIKVSQYSLFCVVSDTNRALLDLNSSIQMIFDEQEKGNKNTEKLIEESQISNYYAKQAQKELSYFNNMQYLSGKYGSVNPLFGTPPT